MLADPAVAYVGSSVGSTGWSPSVNSGSLFISLKPPSERNGSYPAGHRAVAAEDLEDSGAARVLVSRCRTCASAAARASPAYQFTLWDTELRRARGLGSARARGKLQAARAGRRDHRPRAGRIAGRTCRSIGPRRRGSACASRTSTTRSTTPIPQRQVSTIYTQRNQYRVILEIDPLYPARSRRSRPQSM